MGNCEENTAGQARKNTVGAVLWFPTHAPEGTGMEAKGAWMGHRLFVQGRKNILAKAVGTAMDSRCKPADLGIAGLHPDNAQLGNDDAGNSEHSRRLRGMDRHGPGEVSQVDGPCAERRDCRSFKPLSAHPVNTLIAAPLKRSTEHERRTINF